MWRSIGFSKTCKLKYNKISKAVRLLQRHKHAKPLKIASWIVCVLIHFFKLNDFDFVDLG